MNTELGTLILSDDLILDGIENSPGISFSQRRTLTGESIVQSNVLTGGRKLKLISKSDLTFKNVQDIKSIENTGQPVILKHERGTFNVLITSLDVSPDIERPEPEDADWFSGTINLLEV